MGECWSADCRGPLPLLVVRTPQLKEVMRLPTHSEIVLHQQSNELLSGHQSNWNRVLTPGFVLCPTAEVTGGNDETLLVCAETAADLSDGGGLHVLLPTLHLNGHLSLNYVSND